MKIKSIYTTWAYSLGLSALLGAGVWLFAVREHKFKETIAHEMSVRAQPASELIIKDQFLILCPKYPKISKLS